MMIAGIFYLLSLCPATEQHTSNTSMATHVYQLPGEIMEVVFYYDNGLVRQHGFMQDGELTGTWTTFNANGIVTAKAYYDKGQKTGKWKVYDEAGKLRYKICYHNDIKLWVQRFDDQGNVADIAVR